MLSCLLQVLGWDLVLPQMAVGEVVYLKCSPAYAYGERGAPPKIPPNAHMHFELELLSVRYLQSSHNDEEALTVAARLLLIPSVPPPSQVS